MRVILLLFSNLKFSKRIVLIYYFNYLKKNEEYTINYEVITGIINFAVIWIEK